MLVRHKKATAIGIVIALFAMGGVAFAYWTQSGGGTGTASTGTTTGIEVVQDSVAGGLYPGGEAGDLAGYFNNSNAGSVEVLTVVAEVDPDFTSRTDLNKPACTSADFAIGGTSGPYTVAPNTTPANATRWSGLTISLVNGAANQDNCKNVDPDILYSTTQ